MTVILTHTFNRLDKKNIITSVMYGQMTDPIAQAQTDADVRVVAIQGHKSIFSDGYDH
jgi:enoyl-CoA hydratase/carnithine racemase